MKVIDFKGNKYPFFQSTGNAAQFAIPFAKHICTGRGLDIGCMKKEWAFPGAIPIDIDFEDEWDAYNLPEDIYDYIFSSHCLEHLPNWVEALDYWTSRIVPGGHLFLYLPHPSQLYWAPFHNHKHYHSFEPELIESYLKSSGRYWNIFVSGADANNSFTAFAEKR
jgi:SAM-dependent methyltransferase